MFYCLLIKIINQLAIMHMHNKNLIKHQLENVNFLSQFSPGMLAKIPRPKCSKLQNCNLNFFLTQLKIFFTHTQLLFNDADEF